MTFLFKIVLYPLGTAKKPDNRFDWLSGFWFYLIRLVRVTRSQSGRLIFPPGSACETAQVCSPCTGEKP